MMELQMKCDVTCEVDKNTHECNYEGQEEQNSAETLRIFFPLFLLSELKKRELVMPVEGSAAVTSKYVSDSHHFLVSIT